MTTMRSTDRRFLAGLITGIAGIVIWFVATRTTLLLAYRGGSLSQVQAICSSGIGQLGRIMSTQANAECASIDRYAMWLNVLGFAALLLVIGSAGVLIYRAMQRPSAASTSLR
jgi:hypothetical protein